METSFNQGHACIIGIGDDLPCTVGDAEGLSKILKDPQRCAYPEQQVHLLTGQAATRQNIISTLEGLADTTTEESTVLVYFSGHGFQVTKPFKTYYLLPYGYNTDNLSDTALSGAELVDLLREIPAKKLLLLLDCCHASGLTDLSGFQVEKAPLPPEAYRMFSKGGGRMIIGSSLPDELSYAGNPYSAFTTALIEGLCGQGITKEDGYVRAADLAMYASRTVPAATQNRQHPALDIEKADNFVLAYYAGGDKKHKSLPPELMNGSQIEAVPGKLHGQGVQVGASGERSVAVGGNISESTIITGNDSINISGGQDIYIGARIFTNSSPLKAIDWDKVSFKENATNLGKLFTRHLNHGQSSPSTDNHDLYVPLYLQGNESESKKLEESEAQAQVTDVKVKTGTWGKFIKHPGDFWITGDAGSGKTTILLSIAKELSSIALADKNRPIPFYLKLNKFKDNESISLLANVARENGQNHNVLRALWNDESLQPLCLLLDGVDELKSSCVQHFIDELNGLLAVQNLKKSSVILSSRPGEKQSLLKREIHSSFQSLTVLPLNDEQINELLLRSSSVKSSEILGLDNNFQNFMRNPGTLTAIAASTHNLQLIGYPENAGQAYKFFLDYYLSANGREQYDHGCVKRVVLSYLAFSILSKDSRDLLVDDTLYYQVAHKLDEINRHYGRSRMVMPENWTAQEFLNELAKGDIIAIEGFPDSRLYFRERLYLEYYSAVYLENLDIESPELDSILKGKDNSRWVNSLILLGGLQPDSLDIIDKLFHSQIQHATDVWMEKKPYGIETPPCILNAFEVEKEHISPSSEIVLGALSRTRKWIHLLEHDNPATRLEALYGLEESGIHAIHNLVEAAEDSHPIVQAIAQYTILHIGECTQSTPTIEYERNSFHFRCCGGINLWIGPLRLIDVPKHTQAHLTVNIEKLDFNPFEEESSFEIWHTTPALFAFHFFMSEKTPDWIKLTARCQWIAKYSATVADQLKNIPKLSNLVNELFLRAAHYDAFGSRLALELNLPWEYCEVPGNQWISTNSETSYKQFISIFNRINRGRLFEAPSLVPDKSIDTQLNIESACDAVIKGISVNEVDLQTKRGDRLVDFKRIDYKINCERISKSELTGIEVNRIKGDPYAFQAVFEIEGKQNIEHVSKSTIKGLSMNHCSPSSGGLKAAITMNIERFSDSRLFGVTRASST